MGNFHFSVNLSNMPNKDNRIEMYRDAIQKRVEELEVVKTKMIELIFVSLHSVSFCSELVLIIRLHVSKIKLYWKLSLNLQIPVLFFNNRGSQLKKINLKFFFERTFSVYFFSPIINHEYFQGFLQIFVIDYPHFFAP